MKETYSMRNWQGYDKNYFSVHQIAGNAEVFSDMIGFGFATAATILVGGRNLFRIRKFVGYLNGLIHMNKF